MNANADELLDTVDVGRRLGVAPSTVSAWGRTGLIPRIRVARKTVRYSWTAVLFALRARGVCCRCGVPTDEVTAGSLDEHYRPLCRGCSPRRVGRGHS